MKIAYQIDFLNELGGVERVTIVKANALAERGHDVVLLTPDIAEGGPPPVEPISDKVRVETLDTGLCSVKKWTILKYLRYTARHRKAFQRWIDREKPDILVSTGYLDRYVRPFLRMSRGGKKTHFVRELHLDPDQNRKTKVKAFVRIAGFFEYRLLAWNIDRFVLLTRYYQDNWRGDKRKVSVINNPITITPIVSDVKIHRVIAVGRFVKQKDFGTLIRAFSIVARTHTDWTLEFYGSGEEETAMRQLVSELGLDSRVRFMGRTDNIPKAMSEASILACSSLYEGLSLTVLEGMACGLPIVSTDCHGDAGELFGPDMDCSVLVPVGDYEKMAQGISRLIEDPALRERMSQKALKRSEAFSLPTIIDRWEALFNELACQD